jgi:hypothetical protein
LADIPVGALVDTLFFPVAPFVYFSAAEISACAVNHHCLPASGLAGASAPNFSYLEPDMTTRSRQLLNNFNNYPT